MTILFTILALCALLVWWGDRTPRLTEYTISASEELSGLKIAHISDLHNTQLGRDNEKILKILAEAQPDIIAVTGDMIDSRNTNIDVALAFAGEAMEIAPLYYATGNHESRIADYPLLESGLRDMGAAVLRDEAAEIKGMAVIGLDDPAFRTHDAKDTARIIDELKGDAPFALVLSHRPELLDSYAESGADLVLSGHAHGGQIRLPFIGGVIAPHQGFFPELTEGVHEKGGTSLVISRGLGNSLFPFRVNNRPEVVLITLK